MNDSAFTLYIAPTKNKQGWFKKGHTPWNKGLSWEQQGWTEERKKKVITQLKINKSKNEYGNKLHWYASSEAAARKLGITGRNIRKVCDGERHTCGGYCWKWDERFL